jgi:hypothetical protein
MEKDELQTVVMNRQQICAALSISESTIRRLEHAGLPYTPVGVRSKRYDLAECRAWLRTEYVPPTRDTAAAGAAADLQRRTKAFTESCKKMKFRVKPSA